MVVLQFSLKLDYSTSGIIGLNKVFLIGIILEGGGGKGNSVSLDKIKLGLHCDLRITFVHLLDQSGHFEASLLSK